MPRTAKVVGEVSVNPEAFNILHAKIEIDNLRFVDIKNLVQQIQI